MSRVVRRRQGVSELQVTMRTFRTGRLSAPLIVATVVAACSSSTAGPAPGQPLYVANRGQSCVGPSSGGSITIYAGSATGNATPTATVGGGNTGLSNPWGIVTDAAGRLYVTNSYCSGDTGRITVYAAGATGNAPPVATIAGSNTGLSVPTGIALDATGRLFVANSFGNSVTVYAA